ncbi:hypothetical protein [Polaromonas sp.]|uniref:hypothetical protein n=1 Tax=Polaromonas sp. TaxID=1869339 RepID=UPI00179CBF15|nr:hypothetical protein [Polaromonas sp.]NMM07720.1 hypothetical protein [Polaromonas sp.]
MTPNDKKWEQLLTPAIAREKLISASMYITAFELLKDSIIDRVRSFYADSFDQNGPIVGPEYQAKVLSRSKSVLYASLNWLLENDAINKQDIQLFESIKATRNSIAHGLHTLVIGDADFKHIERFQELVALLRKIEVWWVVSFEIPTNPDFDGQEIDESGIVPGPVLMLQMMLEVVSGNEEFLNHYRQARPCAKNDD